MPTQLEALPSRVFSGKAHLQAGTQAVFFCFALPGKDATVLYPETDAHAWTLAAGRTEWLLLDLHTGHITSDAASISSIIDCQPNTPRRCETAQPTLVEARNRVEKYLKNGYFRQVQAPLGVRPVLVAWMELN